MFNENSLWDLMTDKPCIYKANLGKDRRITLPHELFRFMDETETLILTNSYKDDTLLLCSEDVFEDIRRALGSINAMDPNMRKIKRRVIGEYVNVKPDSRNRLYIKKKFLRSLGYDANKDDFGNLPVIINKRDANRIEIISAIAYYERLDKANNQS